MAGRALLEGFETVLVLGGGNALGACHLGVCEALLPVAEPDPGGRLLHRRGDWRRRSRSAGGGSGTGASSTTFPWTAPSSKRATSRSS